MIATGSELQLAVAAAIQIKNHGYHPRVVSMPCAERFIGEDTSYQESVLPCSVRNRIAIEAAAKGYWYRFVGLDGAVIGLDTFGASAPAEDLYNYFGINVEKIVEAAVKMVS